MDVDDSKSEQEQLEENVLYYQYLPKQMDDYHTGIKLDAVFMKNAMVDYKDDDVEVTTPITPDTDDEPSDDEQALQQNGILFKCISALWVEILISHLSITSFVYLPNILIILIKKFTVWDSQKGKESEHMNSQYDMIPKSFKFGYHSRYNYPYDLIYLNFDLFWNPIKDWEECNVDIEDRNKILKEIWAKLSSFAKYMVDCRRDFQIETNNITKESGISGVYSCIKPSMYFKVDLFFCDDLLNECTDQLPHKTKFLTADGMLIDPETHNKTWINLPLIRYMLKIYCAYAYYRLPHLHKYGSIYIQMGKRYRSVNYFPDTYGLNWRNYQFQQIYPHLREIHDGSIDREQVESLLIETNLRR